MNIFLSYTPLFKIKIQLRQVHVNAARKHTMYNAMIKFVRGIFPKHLFSATGSILTLRRLPIQLQFHSYADYPGALCVCSLMSTVGMQPARHLCQPSCLFKI